MFSLYFRQLQENLIRSHSAGMLSHFNRNQLIYMHVCCCFQCVPFFWQICLINKMKEFKSNKKLFLTKDDEITSNTIYRKILSIQFINVVKRCLRSGVGEPLSPERTRMLLALRINVLAKGHSGISLDTLQQYVAAFNGMSMCALLRSLYKLLLLLTLIFLLQNRNTPYDKTVSIAYQQ